MLERATGSMRMAFPLVDRRERRGNRTHLAINMIA
jgi:hypothetical protein